MKLMNLQKKNKQLLWRLGYDEFKECEKKFQSQSI